MTTQCNPAKVMIGAGDQIPLLFVLLRNGKPVDLTGKTVKFRLLDSAGAVAVDWTAAEGVQDTFAVTFADGRAEAIGHEARNGDQIELETSNTLPTPLVEGDRYFVRDAGPNEFKLGDRPSGSVTPSGAGSGTHTAKIIGSTTIVVPESIQAGSYRLWLRIEGDASETFGHPEGVALQVS